MKTIIAGSRSLTDYHLIDLAVNKIDWAITEVVCGCAAGVDLTGRKWAKDNNITVREMPAAWTNLEARPRLLKARQDGTLYNVYAGKNRNLEMAGYAEALIAIWDGSSTGTRHMITAARGRGLKVAVFKVSYGDGGDGAPLTATLIQEPEPPAQ